MSYSRNHALLQNARLLRKNQTKEERHLWFDFLRYCKPRFRRQEIISNYILDFFCHEAKLAIELDGSQHFDSKALDYDAKRTAYLEGLGITLVRFPNSDIQNNFRGVCDRILFLLADRGFHTSVTFGDSSPQGEP